MLPREGVVKGLIRSVRTYSGPVVRSDLPVSHSPREGSNDVRVGVHRDRSVAVGLVVHAHWAQDYEEKCRLGRHHAECWLQVRDTLVVRTWAKGFVMRKSIVINVETR